MNKFIQLAIMAAVGVILTFSLLLPIVDNSTAENKEYTNEGASFALMDDQEHTMVITNDNGNPVYVVDDELISVNPAYAFNSQSTVIYGEDGLFRVWKVGNTTRLRMSAEQGIVTPVANLDVGQSATITFNSESLTFQGETINIKPVAYLANNADYTQSIKPVVNSESVIYFAGLTEGIHNDVNQFIAIAGTGTIGELTINILYSKVGTDVNVVGETHTVTTTDLGNGLKKIQDIEITFALSDDTTHTAHYTYFIAPEKISYENPVYVGSDMAAMLNLLPLLLVMALVLIIVGYAVRARLS